ncbi:TPA: type II toxin-antitoxin system prevent-host-death family antitoxin [Enterobacter bugandensis]|nr:type II toxin-antitoxin system prevent-host-death family antitoxin [Enterobacter bugandensis]
MRKVSYTQMRAELSDILDAIRNGETVVVTQRGRPDTVLSGALAGSENVLPRESSLQQHVPHIKTYLVEGHLKDGSLYHSNTSAHFTRNRLDSMTLVKTSFSEALKKTQKKHAKIIKALEDK